MYSLYAWFFVVIVIIIIITIVSIIIKTTTTNFVLQRNKNSAVICYRPGGKEREQLIAWTVLIVAVGWIATVRRQCRLDQQCSEATCCKDLTLCSLQQLLSDTTNKSSHDLILASDSWHKGRGH